MSGAPLLDAVDRALIVATQGGLPLVARPYEAIGEQLGIAGSEVGRIDLFDFHSYVAIMGQSVEQALRCLSSNRIKGRFFKVRRIGSGRTS